MGYICHAVGARPQFIKLASVLPIMSELVPCRVLHTGQHYDRGLSADFFSQLDIPEPDWNLGVGSGPHGRQTGRMIEGVETVLLGARPDALMVYGDTNSTLASALAAAKINVPVLHVESGLRSFDKSAPEEVNRVLTDHLSELLFCPSRTAVDNLAREGVTDGVHLVGDVMLDMLLNTAGGASRLKREVLEVRADGGETLKLEAGEYYLATLHRAENVDNPDRLSAILRALSALPKPTLFPVHPRTAKEMRKLGDAGRSPALLATEPAGYMRMLEYLAGCRVLFTDSGGLQKEAYYLGVPCATLRDRTEWVETTEQKANVLVDDDYDRIQAAAEMSFPDGTRADVYGDGSAGDKISRIVRSFLPYLGNSDDKPVRK